jgi:ubiquinone/menaquinone biosynthesis C-methylase UbiE
MAAIAARLGSRGVVVGLDRQPARLDEARRRDARLAVVVGDLNGVLPFRSSTFDRAVCHNALELVADKNAFLGEVGRTLKPGFCSC